jgi:3-oxoadipate enol-lactonase
MTAAAPMFVAGPAGRLAVHVTVPARPTGETVLLVHPANLGGGCWRAVAQRIGPAATCVALDLRGHGGSDRGGPFSVAAWAEDCAAVIDALELGPVHLVGASVGGAIVVELAVDRPDAVRSLTAVGGAFLPAEDAAGPLLETIDALGAAEALRLHAARDALAPGSPPELTDRVVADLSANDAATTAAIWRASLRTDVRPRIAALRAPALAVVGEHDTTCPPAESAEFARLAGARLEPLRGVGHLPMYEAPGRLAELIAEHAALPLTPEPHRSTR